MRWNDYLYQANTEAARRYVARRRENSANNRAMREAILTRVRDNPTSHDIEMGDALNAAVNQLTDPRISSAALRLASAPIEAKVIQDIAFRNAAEAVTIVLSQIRHVTKWPTALEAPRFAAEKAEFEALGRASDQGRRRRGGLFRHSEVGSRFGRQTACQPRGRTPRRDRAREEATRFLKTFAGLVRLLERPDTTEAFNQLRTVETTTLGNLLAFMEIYNLRFGQATTPRQRAIYRDLSAKIDAVRDQVVKPASGEENRGFLSNLTPVFDFFSSLFRF